MICYIISLNTNFYHTFSAYNKNFLTNVAMLRKWLLWSLNEAEE